jgi:hypothetical protein
MSDLDDSMAQVIETTKMRILHALEVFPFISGSMLHQAIGTSTSGNLWKPLLDQLIESGDIVETNLAAKSPTGRAQSYTIYHLAKNKYCYGNV